MRGFWMGDFEVIIWESKPQRHGTIFMGEVDPSRHCEKILIWKLKEG